MISLVFQQVVLARTDGSYLEFPASASPAKVESGPTTDLPPIDGVPVVNEPPPASVSGWPSGEGQYIVSAQAALAARELGLVSAGEIYSAGPLVKRTDGHPGMMATQLRRWPDWPSKQ